MLDQSKPNHSEDTSDLLALHTSYKDINQRYIELNNELKAVSRKIGEAKKQKLPFDKLKSKSRKLSLLLKPLNEELNKLNEEIQAEFNRLRNHDKVPINNEGTLQKENDKSYIRYRPFEISPQDVNINVISTDTTAGENVTSLQQWNQYILNHPATTIHHKFEWQNILHRTYGHKSYYFYATAADGSIVGVLPVIRLTSRFFGDMMVSMPYFQRGGAIAENAEIEALLIKAAEKKANALSVKSIEYRDDIKRINMPVQQHKVNMVLSLPNSSEALWRNFSTKLRAQIKRPQREAPQRKFGNLELLDDFYNVYARNMRDLGSPVHSKKFIKIILESFPDNSWLVIAYHKNHAVAAALLLAYKDTMEIPLASTIRDVNRYSMNMFLYWEILQFAIKKKFKYFDFGRSTIDSGTYRFKRQWGAKQEQLYWHYWLADRADLPSLNPDNPKFALAITVWKKMPVFITKFIGPYIVQNLP